MKNNDILRWVVIGGLFCIPFSVLIVADSLFFPFITGKAFFYRIVVEIVFAAWILLALKNANYRPHIQKIYYVLFALLGMLFVSNMLSVAPYKAFWSNFERMDGWISLIHHAMFFVVISSMFTTYQMWQKFWKVSFAVSVVVSLYGLLQRIGVMEAIQGGGVRVDGTFGNAAYLAVYNLFHIFLAVWLLYKSRSKGMRILYGAIGVFNLFNLYWTATRGVFVGLAAGILVTTFIILIKDKEHKKVRMVAGALLLGLVIIVGSIFALKNTDFVMQNPTLSRIATISLAEGEVRFTVWSMALKGVAEKPIIGWGQEGFSAVFAKYYEPKMYTQEPWFDRAHNIVIDWLVAGGVVGLTLYLSVLGLGLYYMWRSEWLDVFEKALFTGLYTGYFIQNLFVFDNVGSYILFFGTLAFFTVGARINTEPLFRGKTVSHATSRLMQPIVVIGLIFVLYTVNINPLRAGQEFISAYASNQKPEYVVEAFEKSLSRNTFAHYEVMEQMMTQGPGFLQNQQISNELKQRYGEILEEALEKENERQSENARFNYAAGVFYNNIEQSEKALTHLTRAHELSPVKQIISFELGFAYINTGEAEKGMQILKETYELDSNFTEARKMYLLGAIYTGNTVLEQELASGLSEGFEATDNRFIQAYVNTGRYNDLLDVWQAKVRQEPGNVQHYVSLAATYLELGRREDAVSTLRQAIEIEPRFKEQGEQFIEGIRSGTL